MNETPITYPLAGMSKTERLAYLEEKYIPKLKRLLIAADSRIKELEALLQEADGLEAENDRLEAHIKELEKAMSEAIDRINNRCPEQATRILRGGLPS